MSRCNTRDVADGPLCVELSSDDVHGFVEVVERPDPRNEAVEIVEEHAQVPLVLGALPFSRKLSQFVKF